MVKAINKIKQKTPFSNFRTICDGMHFLTSQKCENEKDARAKARTMSVFRLLDEGSMSNLKRN